MTKYLYKYCSTRLGFHVKQYAFLPPKFPTPRSYFESPHAALLRSKPIAFSPLPMSYWTAVFYWHCLFMSAHLTWQIENTPLRKPSSLIGRKFILDVITLAQGCCIFPVYKGALPTTHSCIYLIYVSSFCVAMLLSSAAAQTVVGGYVCVSEVIQRLQSQRRSSHFVE